LCIPPSLAVRDRRILTPETLKDPTASQAELKNDS